MRAVSEEVELFRRWRAGDAAAGDALLRSCFPPLFRFFRNKVMGEVDDLIQQTLLGCVESREAIRDPEHFWSFMFRVARNRLYDRLRRDLTLDAQVDPGVTSLHDMGASPSSVIAHGERQQLVGEALRRIPLDYQIALELSYWEGMKAPQIADVLELNPNTVRTRITRARAALREQLSQLGVAPDHDEELLSS